MFSESEWGLEGGAMGREGVGSDANGQLYGVINDHLGQRGCRQEHSYTQ